MHLIRNILGLVSLLVHHEPPERREGRGEGGREGERGGRREGMCGGLH